MHDNLRDPERKLDAVEGEVGGGASASIPRQAIAVELELIAGEPQLIPRVVAFDVGDRRIGVAISDPLGYTAQPLFTLHRTGRRADLKSIARVLRKHGVTEAVVGNPLYMSGDQSPQAAKAQAFAGELRTEFGITVHLWDERLTTTEAHRHLDDAGHRAGRERKGIIDQVAAVLILQAFLAARANAVGRGSAVGGIADG